MWAGKTHSMQKEPLVQTGMDRHARYVLRAPAHLCVGSEAVGPETARAGGLYPKGHEEPLKDF